MFATTPNKANAILPRTTSCLRSLPSSGFLAFLTRMSGQSLGRP